MVSDKDEQSIAQYTSDVAHSSRSKTNPSGNRKCRALLLSAASIGIICLVTAIYVTLFQGVEPGLSFIAALQSGDITVNKIKAAYILKHVFTTWPFEESDYGRMRRIGITNQVALEELLLTMKTRSSMGQTPRNHPGTAYGGILQIDANDGRRFYIYYHLECGRTGYFVTLQANTANSTNPNGATTYENTMIIDWLKRNDPWFKSIESVPIKSD